MKGKPSLSVFYHRIAGKNGTAVAFTAAYGRLAGRYCHSITKGRRYRGGSLRWVLSISFALLLDFFKWTQLIK